MTPSETEPETFRLVAPCLKQPPNRTQQQRALYMKTNTHF